MPGPGKKKSLLDIVAEDKDFKGHNEDTHTISDEELKQAFELPEKKKTIPSSSATQKTPHEPLFVDVPKEDESSGTGLPKTELSDKTDNGFFTPESTQPVQENLLSTASEEQKLQLQQKEEALKKSDNGIGRIRNAGAQFVQSVYGLPADMLETIAIGSNQVGRLTEAAGLEDRAPVEQQLPYIWAQKYRNYIAELSPTNPALAQNWETQTAAALGQLTTLVMSGGAKSAPTALQEFNKAGNLFSTGAKELGNIIKTPPALIGAMQTGVAEFHAAKNAGASDDQAFQSFLENAGTGSILEALPVAHFFNRLNKTTGGGIVNVIKNGSVQGVEEMTTEVAQQLFSNISASESYDAARKWYDGMTESGGIGFGLGFFLGAMGTSLRQKKEDAKTPEEKAQIQKGIDFTDQKSEELKQQQELIDKEEVPEEKKVFEPGDTVELSPKKNEETNTQTETTENNPEQQVPAREEVVSPAGEEVKNPTEEPSIDPVVFEQVKPVAQKIAEGATDFSPEELQIQQNYPKEIEQVLSTLKNQEDATTQGKLTESDQQQHQGTDALRSGTETSDSNIDEQSGEKQKEAQTPEEKIKAEEVKKPNKKERKATKKILEDDKISQELKDGISEEAKYYIPRTDKLNDHEANALIEYKGLDQSQKEVLDFENDLHPAVRVKLRKNLIRRLDKLASEARDAGDIKTEKKYRNDAIKLSEEHGTKGTAIASALQAYHEHITEKSASQIIYESEKMIKGAKKRVKDINKAEIEGDVAAARENIKQTTEEVVKSKKYKDKINKIREKLSEGPDKIKDEKQKKFAQKRTKVKENLKNAKDEFHTILKELRGQANAGIDPRLVKAATKYGYYAVLDGSYDFAEWSKKMVEDLGETIQPHLEKIWGSVHEGENLSSLAKEVQAHEVGQHTRREILKNLDEKIGEIVGKHYNDVQQVKTDLTKKLMDGLDLSPADAKALATTIQEEFDALYHEKKDRALKSKLGANPKVPDKKAKQFHEELLKLLHMGALHGPHESNTERNMTDLYMKKFDIPSLTETQKAEITKLVEKIHSLPENSLQQRAVIEKLLALQTNLKGVRKIDVATSIWYAGILSGYTTQLRNIYANTSYLIGEIIKDGVYGLSKGDTKRFKLSMIGLYQGFGRGMYEAAGVLKTGVTPDKTGKIDAPMLLERYAFKWGKFNPYNYAKYISRLMSAADIFFYHGAKEMRAYQLAHAENSNPSMADRNKVYEKLFNTKENKLKAQEQAKAEGLTGNDYKRRVYEIIEQKRGDEANDQTRLYGLKATFNQEPEGTLGLLTGAMGNISNKFLPLKFIVPFTRILSNVANNYAEWTPYGFVRVAKNGIGWGDNYVKYSEEERTKVFISAAAGTLAMASIYALTADEDDENGIEITANLTGDFKKNYEINKPQYSIRIGDTWFNYQDTPFAIPMAIVGYIRDAEKYKEDKDLDTRMSIAAFGTIKYLSDLTFMQGLSDFFDAFAKSGNEGASSFWKKMEKQGVTVAKGVIVPNVFTQTVRLIDDIFQIPLKQADGLLEQIYRDIPIANNSLHDMVNVLGEPVYANIENRFLPFQVKSQKDHKVFDLLNEKNAFILRISKAKLENMTGVAVTGDQYYQFSKRRGELIKEQILENFEELSQMPPDEARDQIKAYKKSATSQAKEEVFLDAITE